MKKKREELLKLMEQYNLNESTKTGEIEAKDVQQRIDFSQRELRQNIPESSKNNPVHPQTNELLQQRINELAKNKNNKYNRKKGRGLFEEEITQDYQKSENKNSKYNQEHKGNGIELDNSSFSLDQNAKKERVKLLVDK